MLGSVGEADIRSPNVALSDMPGMGAHPLGQVPPGRVAVSVIAENRSSPASAVPMIGAFP
jgi:hypothetical protein